MSSVMQMRSFDERLKADRAVSRQSGQDADHDYIKFVARLFVLYTHN